MQLQRRDGLLAIDAPDCERMNTDEALLFITMYFENFLSADSVDIF